MTEIETLVKIFLCHYLCHKSYLKGGDSVPVVMRLARWGVKKKPFYRVVIADSRSPRDGRFLEIVGTYNPLIKKENFKIDQEKAISWLKKGVQPSKTVKNLLAKKGIEV